jgi:hypothetical protein
MQKLISILLGVVLVSCFAGCDGKKGNRSKADQGTIPISRTIQISPNMPASRAGHYISDIQVTLTDPHGSPIPDKKVELEVSSREVLNMDGTKLTNDTQKDGVASLTVDAKAPELSAQLKVNGKVVEKGLRIRHAVITPPPTDQPKPSKATVQLGPTSRLANGSMLALLEVTVKDPAGNALANVPITLRSDRNDAISPASAHTNQQGQALFSLVYEQPGKRQIQAIWNGTQLGEGSMIDLPLIDVGSSQRQPPPPSTASVQLTDKTSFLPDGRLLALLAVTVGDREGKTVANVPITLESSNRNDAISPDPAHTNQGGQALFSLIYEPPGQRVITVTWNQTPLGRETIPLPAMGQLLVTSQPEGAEVVLDGKSRGVTPQRLDLPFGKHQITLKKRGYKSLEGQQIEVKAVWPPPRSFELQSLKITGSVVFDEPQEPPVAGAVVHIEGTPYQTVTDEKGEFAFSDWVKGELPQTCTLRLEDSQNRFEPESVPNLPIGEFNQDITLKNPIQVKRATKLTVFLLVQGIEKAGGKKPLPDADVFINGTEVEDDNKDGIFQTAVASSTDRVPIRVQQECYETPQGVDVYEDALQIPPNAQNYFVSISLFPKLFFVELPTDWEIPQKPGIGFVAKRSPQDKGGEIGILDGRRVIFHCAPFLIEGRRVSVQMMQNTMSLGPARGLEVKKYKRIQP